MKIVSEDIVCSVTHDRAGHRVVSGNSGSTCSWLIQFVETCEYAVTGRFKEVIMTLYH